MFYFFVDNIYDRPLFVTADDKKNREEEDAKYDGSGACYVVSLKRQLDTLLQVATLTAQHLTAGWQETAQHLTAGCHLNTSTPYCRLPIGSSTPYCRLPP